MPDFQYLGGEHGKGLLESALKQPSQTFDGRYSYRTIFDKAAILLHSMIKNHPLVDGNKRLALTTSAVFLTVNGYLFHAPQAEAVEQCVKIASDTAGVDLREVAKWVRSSSTNLKSFLGMSKEQQERRLEIATGGMKSWGRFLATAIEVAYLLNE